MPIRAQVAAEIARLARSDAGADRTRCRAHAGRFEPGSGIDRTALRHAARRSRPRCRQRRARGISLAGRRGAARRARRPSRRPADRRAPRWTRWSASANPRSPSSTMACAATSTVVDARSCSSASAARSPARHRRRGVAPARRASRSGGRPRGDARARGVGPVRRGSRDRRVRAGRRALDLAESVVVETDLDHATHVLRALVTFDDEPSATLLSAALRDELDLVRQRVLAALAMRHGTAGLRTVSSSNSPNETRAPMHSHSNGSTSP